MRFDLTDLRLFLSVTESSSITRGANATHISVASASERIKNMEREIGTALLFREHRGVRATPAGAALARHARILLNQSEIMRGELSEYARGLRGHVRILSNTSGLSELPPDLLSDYLLTYHNVDLEIEERSSAAIVQAVANGDFDAGIVADIIPFGGLDIFPLFVDQLVLIAPTLHDFATLSEVGFDHALSQDFVGLAKSSALFQHLEWQAARISRSIRWRARLGTFDEICKLVERGVGVAIIPERSAIKALANMNLISIKLSDVWATRQLMICTRGVNELSNHAKQFIDHIRSRTTQQTGQRSIL
jgi:DNA-binding transcriptional LysR family regulator